MSGKHRFIEREVVEWKKFMSLKNEIKCEYCGMIYDLEHRKEKKGSNYRKGEP